MEIKFAKDFIYEEFYSEKFFNEFKDRPYIIYNAISPKLICLVQFIRKDINKPVTVNNWRFGGDYHYSGYREAGCAVGSIYSRHRLGLCADLKVRGVDAPELQQYLKDHYYDKFKEQGLTGIEEETPTWTHITVEDVGWRKKDSIWLIPNPNK